MKMAEIIYPNVGEILNLFYEIRSSGKIFTASFYKTDGTMRTMNCRCRVTKHLKGGKLKYNASKKGLLPVYDLQKEEYRTVNLNTIQTILFQNKLYIF